jgi:hypothetical protein
VVAADKFDGAVGDVFVSVLGADVGVVFYLQTVFIPTAGLADHMKKCQMTLRAIRELYFVHTLALLMSLTVGFQETQTIRKAAAIQLAYCAVGKSAEREA